MKRWLKNGLVIVGLVVTFAVSAGAEEPAGVAAVVNGTTILAVEVEQELRSIIPMNQGFHGAMPEEKLVALRKEALQRLVDAELKYQDARAKKIELSDDERSAAIKKNTSQFRNKAELEAAIKEAGFTRDLYEHFIERPLVSAKISKAEIDDKVTTTDAMVKAYYDKNLNRYVKPKEFRASHILFKIDPSLSNEEKAKVRARGEGILKKIKDGADFGEVASKNSDDLSWIKGGDLGYFHAGQMLPEIEKILDTMKVGEMSGLIESLYGWHLVKLTDLRPSRQLPFEEIKEKIKKDLIESEKKRLKEQWISSITKKAVITYPAVK